MQVPGGFRWVEAATGWRSRPWASFNEVVQSLIAHRKGNPHYNLPTDQQTVEELVDFANAQRCLDQGWNQYIVEGGAEMVLPKPLSPPSLLRKLGRVVGGGSKSLLSWLSSKEEAVPIEEANRRAVICVGCPNNKREAFASFFTMPVSSAITAAIQMKNGWNLTTDHDENLGVCGVCLCPLPLKVHMPIDIIRKETPGAVMAELPDFCWIKETKQ
jgi:hypothetical protein